MIISSAQLFSYQIPLNKLLPVGKQRIELRSGLVFRLQVSENPQAEVTSGLRTELVEISPLSGQDIDRHPLMGFSQESLDDVSQQLAERLESLIGKPLIHLLDLAEETQYPSLAFGLSLLYSKLIGQLDDNGLSLQNTRVVPLIYREEDESISTLQDRIRSLPKDIRSVKIKVAQTSMEEEIKLVHQVLAIRPDLKLRLDANRGLTLEQAIDFAACLPIDAIEYIEEPCIDHNDNPNFYRAIGMPWALDETLNDPKFKFEMQPGLTALVIKPMLIGTLEKIQKLQYDADHYGVRTIISSSLEASLGIESLARLNQVMSPDEIPGLDTLSAFSADLIIDSGKANCLSFNDLTLMKSA
ncbi:O-succinylbenzoate synthase [Shewanella psychrophila]|uniref:o-succinylbenzoate synthase n=1 Tax=Shewanella psychrophila TaxID=225848 RepID=A0A1S6HJ22_9GAMM|nr:o-succinylbenzoate synthase [Shewanella psychrophila]AQS35517.1 O-succinylbenzoate synthase [Shewanella psychrophila]